jgi:hypothetical protein
VAAGHGNSGAAQPGCPRDAACYLDAPAPVLLLRSRMSEAECADFDGKALGQLRSALGEGPVRHAQPALIGVGQR